MRFLSTSNFFSPGFHNPVFEVTPAPTPKPNPNPETPVDTVLETSIDVMAALASCLVGAFTLLIIVQLVWFALRRVGKLHPFIKYFERRSRISGSIAALLLGINLGWVWAMHESTANWVNAIGHGLLIVSILGVTWWLMRLCAVLEDLTRTHRNDPKKPNRLLTQAQVLHRVLQVFFAVTGVMVIAFSFPQARAAMGSVLASAGIISLIAGIAAQGVLANMFAGLQIAFSDSIRVGDLVVVKNESGTVEEITLTYVVVLMWDGRRLILPSKKFTEEVFENWTKRDSQLLGTVEIHADWRLPMASLRNEVDRLLNDTDLWDGRTSNVQVTDSSVDGMVVRVAVSAPNSGDLWDLRCYLREHLIDWIQTQAPFALPRRRLEPEDIKTVDLPADEIDLDRQMRYSVIAHNYENNSRRREAAQEAPEEVSPSTDPYGEPILDQYARKLLDRRRSWRAKARDLDAYVDEADSTPSFSDEMDSLAKTRQFPPAVTITTERLYSGSPDAEARRERLTGANRPSSDSADFSAADTGGFMRSQSESPRVGSKSAPHETKTDVKDIPHE